MRKAGRNRKRPAAQTRSLEAFEELAAAFADLVASGRWFVEIYASLQRILIGFTLGCLVAVPLGLAMGNVRSIRLALEPYVNFFRFIPPIAFLPLVVLWFGIGETSKVALIVYTTLFIVLINTMAGVFQIPVIKIRAARSLGIRGSSLFRFVVIPSTVPFIITGMRIAMGNSFMTVVAAEMLSANSGLGYLIFSSRVFYRTGHMFVGLITLGILGFLADLLFRKVSASRLKHYGVHDRVRRR